MVLLIRRPIIFGSYHVNLGFGLPDAMHSMTAVSSSTHFLSSIGFTNLKLGKNRKNSITSKSKNENNC
jgi:hypothetical protein